MYTPSGSCTSPVAADVYGGSCESYCSSSSSDCAVCEDNTYYEGYSDNTACDSCDEGKYIVSDQASDHASASQCSSCSIGTYLNDDNSCAICPAGTYTDTSGQTSCQICSYGKFLAHDGMNASLHDSADDCRSCEAGKHLANDATDATLHDEESDCLICPSGKGSET